MLDRLFKPVHLLGDQSVMYLARENTWCPLLLEGSGRLENIVTCTALAGHKATWFLKFYHFRKGIGFPLVMTKKKIRAKQIGLEKAPARGKCQKEHSNLY